MFLMIKSVSVSRGAFSSWTFPCVCRFPNRHLRSVVLRVDIVLRLRFVRQLRAVFRLTMSVTGGALVLNFRGVGWNCVLRQLVLSITLLLNR